MDESCIINVSGISSVLEAVFYPPLVLVRANSGDSAILQTSTAEVVKVKLENIEWLVSHVQLSTEYKIRMLKQLERQKWIKMAFRSWDLYEYPTLPSTASHV